MARWRAEYDEWLGTADTVWDREMAREKAGTCWDARSTADENECLGRELDITAANLKAYVDAFRASFRLLFPEQRAPNALSYEKTADEFLKEFDAVEATWQARKEVMCKAAYDTMAGGTIAPSVAARCDLQMMRDHMREVGGILGQFFHM